MTLASSPLARANELLAAGAPNDALRLVAAAIQHGDPEAMHQLALWHVYGQPVRRDFAAARVMLAKAAAAGHYESARMHAVFVAIGAGGPACWADAVAALERTATSDGIAARQCELLAAMQLDADGMPSACPALRPMSASPRLGRVETLFTPDEAAHVRALSLPLLRPSIVTDPATGKLISHPIRTSDGAVLGPIQQDLVIHALNCRIAAVTGTREQQGEPLTVLRYRPGQQYRLHHDCLPHETNQRIITAITYLNDGYGEGSTVFPALNAAVQGRTGDVLVFDNVLPDGRPDERSRHAGTAVEHGEKWICTRWIRKMDFDPWGMREYR